ncbi:MAG: hypothetical protein QM730_02650 [Anaerolineales bacterium]
MKDHTPASQHEFWPAWGIPLMGVVATTITFTLNDILFHIIVDASDKRLELNLVGLVLIITIFVIPITNWMKMGRWFKVAIHLIFGSILLAVHTWLTDTAGSLFLLDSMRIISWVSFIGIVIVMIYLVIVTAIDVHSFQKENRSSIQIPNGSGWLLFFILVCGWLSILWGVNYFSAKSGYCKFPPAYTYLQELGKENAFRTAFITSMDLDCKYFRQISPMDFLIQNEYANEERNLPFNGYLTDRFRGGYYSSVLETYFYSHVDMEISEYMWVQKDRVSNADIDQVLGLSNFQALQTTGDFDLFENDISGPLRQQYQCEKTDTGATCTVFLVYEHIVIGFSIVAPESAFETIIPNAILNMNERLLRLDLQVPMLLDKAIVLHRQPFLAT